MPFRRDHTPYTFLLTIGVIAMLLLLGLIPSFSVGGIRIKQINILSDIPTFDKAETGAEFTEYSDTAFMAESLVASSSENIGKALSTPLGMTQDWSIDSNGEFVEMAEPKSADIIIPTSETFARIASPIEKSTKNALLIDVTDYGVPTTMIEDFSPPGKGMSTFYEAINNGYEKRPVRIAVLGDSFVEADIITADVREQLQTIYGGEGVGFIPFSSPLAKYRTTVKHTFEGWQTYNITKKKSCPASVQDDFFVSGLACVPSEGAWTRIEGTNFRKNINHSSVARIIFTNTAYSIIHVTVNDSINAQFTLKPSPLVQQINLHGDISSIKIKVTSVEGFTGYGIVLENKRGITVDNFSIRGNSGMALFGTNSIINSQIDRLIGYDLIVLQYGLNAMSPDILSYATYTNQLVKVVSYMRDCFPSSAIMLMSVGDRSTLKSGEYVTMPAAQAMLKAQLKAAQQGKAAFWNTFEAMGGEKSMVKFVDKKWAAKDYTHIGYPGGKYIATEFVRSILYGYRNYNGEDLKLDSLPRTDYVRPAEESIAPKSQADTVHAVSPSHREDMIDSSATMQAPAEDTTTTKPASIDNNADRK